MVFSRKYLGKKGPTSRPSAHCSVTGCTWLAWLLVQRERPRKPRKPWRSMATQRGKPTKSSEILSRNPSEECLTTQHSKICSSNFDSSICQNVRMFLVATNTACMVQLDLFLLSTTRPPNPSATSFFGLKTLTGHCSHYFSRHRFKDANVAVLALVASSRCPDFARHVWPSRRPGNRSQRRPHFDKIKKIQLRREGSEREWKIL